MRWIVLLLFPFLVLLANASPNPDPVDLLAVQSVAKQIQYSAKHAKNSTCTLKTVSIRKEWSALSLQERKAYIDAVLCLQALPPKTPAELVPGARSRFDDFLALHINQTLSIHNTTNFLSWHRQYLWSYEKALKEECGYKGSQPYWNWGKYANDPINSPLFDGGEYSLGGNGADMSYPPVCIPNCENPNLIIPSGVGGGCVTTGPFKNYTVTLGPVAPSSWAVNASADPFAYNPRCLRRDISVYTSSHSTTTQQTYDVITQHDDLYGLQYDLEGNYTLFKQGIWGVHTGGHLTVGGDPGGDLFASPGDPAFYLHHAMIDRVWWIWQNQKPEARTYELSGTITLADFPPSRNGTLDDILDMGFAGGEPIQIRDAMSTLGGDYCYIYA
ncbi:tyrosinase central domain-containing protein [Phlyctema vagabunda]|uniref:Tyrosinase central domain-containing protein n=1 Tax=Phlyctema vagabunda TaxID=108571 RepID=A0ABR4P5T0_9HELO